MDLDILQAIDDPKVFGPAFTRSDSWTAWRAFLAALFGLSMDAEQQGIYAECTQRDDHPTEQAKEAWLICGGRSGKSFTRALVAVFLACFRDWTPHLGIRPTISS
jgi:phage/plasmid-associated DNA primase